MIYRHRWQSEVSSLFVLYSGLVLKLASHTGSIRVPQWQFIQMQETYLQHLFYYLYNTIILLFSDVTIPANNLSTLLRIYGRFFDALIPNRYIRRFWVLQFSIILNSPLFRRFSTLQFRIVLNSSQLRRFWAQ